MAIGVGESEVVEFTSTLTQSNERLKFESKYKVKNVKTNQGEKIVMAESEEFYSDDTFMILEYEEKKNSFDPIFNSKSKFLVHLEGQSISQVYLVGKKYQFENGISESFTLLSMSDANVVERVSQVCNNGVMRR